MHAIATKLKTNIQIEYVTAVVLARWQDFLLDGRWFPQVSVQYPTRRHHLSHTPVIVTLWRHRTGATITTRFEPAGREQTTPTKIEVDVETSESRLGIQRSGEAVDALRRIEAEVVKEFSDEQSALFP